MNQSKLEVVKEGMARVNVDILGVRELKWTGMGEFNSDDHYIYYCELDSLRRNGVAIRSTKESKIPSLKVTIPRYVFSAFLSICLHLQDLIFLIKFTYNFL